VLSRGDEAIIVAVRKHILLLLDEMVEAAPSWQRQGIGRRITLVVRWKRMVPIRFLNRTTNLLK
jgi:hypothetical protein